MCRNHRNQINCFLPPYMSDKLKKSKDPEVAATCKKNDELSKKIRIDRKYISSRKEDVQEIFLEKAEVTEHPEPNIEIYDCHHTLDLPGIFMTKDYGDKDFINVKKNLEISWKFYYDLFSRNSFNNKGAKMITSINYSSRYNNAHWDGRQFIFGEGDGVNYKSFTSDIDLVGHEFTHGVSPIRGALDYSGESGALTESFSDVMGIMIKQHFLNLDVKQSSWLLGENVLIDSGYSVRSLKDPGSAFSNHPIFGNDPQPKIYDANISVRDVHKFCGIPNYAFYIASYNMKGNAWERAGKIWYGAYSDLIFPKTNFRMFRDATVKKATELFPGGIEIQAVKDGWNEANVPPWQI